MRLSSVLSWGCGIWVAAGVEAAFGGGMPGPLLLTALAAGLWAGGEMGLLVGVGAGLCGAALCGQQVILWVALCALAGMGASILTRWFSRRHLLVGVFTAVSISLVLTFFLALSVHHPLHAAVSLALWRSGVNALWMCAIYGIVLIASARGTQRHEEWEY